MSEPTLQELIQTSLNLRNEAAEYAQREKDVRKRKDEIDEQIIALLTAMGVDSTRTDVASVSIQKQNVANVESWEDFSDFIVENHAVYLLQKRVSAKALEEMAAMYPDGVPGVSFFEKTSLSLRQR